MKIDEELIKKDLNALKLLNYKILPINHNINKILYYILWCNSIENNLFSKIPLEIIDFYIFPNIINKFDPDIDYNNFKVIIASLEVSNIKKWIIYFNMEDYNYKNICFYKIISTDKTYVNARSYKIQIDYLYSTIYSNYIMRLNLPFIICKLNNFFNNILE